MIKLFLVEDEIVMRDGIKKRIDWEAEGIEFVGDASDGELAYPMILDLKPDILITDIKMPFMDGLQLSEMVKKELPDIRIIILSGYDEFSYAQEALRLGVTEYLLKPITPSALLKSIRSVADKLEEERQTRGQTDWTAEELHEKQELERMRLFSALVMNTKPASELIEAGKELGINLTARYYRAAILHFGVEGEAGDAFSEVRNFFREKLYEEVKNSGESWYIADRGPEGFFILATGADREELTGGFEERLQRVVKLMEETERSTWSIGVGSTVNRLSEVKTTYYEATRAVAKRFLSGTNRIFYMEERETEAEGSNADIDISVINEIPHKMLENFLRTGTYDEVEPFVDGIFMTIGEQNAGSMLFLNYLTMDVYFTMARFVKDLGADVAEIDAGAEDINTVVHHLTSWQDSREYLKDRLQTVIRLRDNGSARKYGRLLRDAVSYIDEHYADEDISLNIVASVANISPNHFSSIFSQEMGVTFIEYLIRKRMESAKELLMTTDLRSSEIAYQVGYKDPHYFSYTFKKTQGMTTREYRNRGREA